MSRRRERQFVPLPHGSPYADALEQVTVEELNKHRGKVVAISLTGAGIVGAASTLPELGELMATQFGREYPYAVACGPQ